MRDRRPYLLIPIAAFIAILPVIARGPSCGHDYDFHLINWFEALKQFRHGNLYPHWAYTPAWNAGEPRFVFYPPLSWIIGALLGAILPWTWTPVAYTWVALTAAGLALFYTARSFATPNAALIAAAVYIANPYTLYTAYERTAYAELLAAAWLPLLFHAILRDRVTIQRIAIPVALLWLTNAPAAVMGCYTLAVLAIIHLILPPSPSSAPLSHSRMRLAVTAAIGAALGLGLASFYLIPAAYERRYVQIAYAILPGISPQENFLFHRTSDPDHDGVLRIASIVAVILIALTALALILNQRPRKPFSPKTPSRSLSLPLNILAIVITLMLTPLSSLLWTYLPELRFLQFPWRLCAILATVFALALAQLLSRLTLSFTQTTCTALLAPLLLSFPADHFFRQRCYPEDTVSERLAVFLSANPATDPTDEYTPKGADNDSLDQQNPGYWLAPNETVPPPVPAAPASAPTQFDVAPEAPSVLILNLRNYPAWQITSNGAPITTRLHRPDGLIAFPLPAGSSHIEITYRTLHDHQIGNVVTLLSLIALAFLYLRPRSTSSAHTQLHSAR